jgi:hypothetical protein
MASGQLAARYGAIVAHPAALLVAGSVAIVVARPPVELLPRVKAWAHGVAACLR